MPYLGNTTYFRTPGWTFRYEGLSSGSHISSQFNRHLYVSEVPCHALGARATNVSTV